jgi:hypothetical protein
MNIVLNTKTGQIYIDNRNLHKDEKGFYTISTKKIMGCKIQTKNEITDLITIERINKILNN